MLLDLLFHHHTSKARIVGPTAGLVRPSRGKTRRLQSTRRVRAKRELDILFLRA